MKIKAPIAPPIDIPLIVPEMELSGKKEKINKTGNNAIKSQLIRLVV
jgi:hypothetical protein